MGFKYDILENIGPIVEPIRTLEDITSRSNPNYDPHTSTPFISEILKNIRQELDDQTTLLGFIGLPYTLASYLVEGSSSKDFKVIKTMSYSQPKVLHHLLELLSRNIADYALYQIESGAQVIQVFDSWAGNLSPYDYDTFVKPYQEKVISKIKQHAPHIPIIVYINKSGALIERMSQIGADMISLDWTVSIKEAWPRINNASIGIQGNLDPIALLGSKDHIKQQTEQILQEAKDLKIRHVMNLGHGMDEHTSEEHVQHFVDVVKNFK